MLLVFFFVGPALVKSLDPVCESSGNLCLIQTLVSTGKSKKLYVPEEGHLSVDNVLAHTAVKTIQTDEKTTTICCWSRVIVSSMTPPVLVR